MPPGGTRGPAVGGAQRRHQRVRPAIHGRHVPGGHARIGAGPRSERARSRRPGQPAAAALAAEGPHGRGRKRASPWPASILRWDVSSRPSDWSTRPGLSLAGLGPEAATARIDAAILDIKVRNARGATTKSEQDARDLVADMERQLGAGDPHVFEAGNLLGEILMRQSKFADAIEQFHRVLAAPVGLLARGPPGPRDRAVQHGGRAARLRGYQGRRGSAEYAREGPVGPPRRRSSIHALGGQQPGHRRTEYRRCRKGACAVRPRLRRPKQGAWPRSSGHAERPAEPRHAADPGRQGRRSRTATATAVGHAANRPGRPTTRPCWSP